LLFLYFSSWQKEGGGYNRALKMGIKKFHLCCSYRRLSQPASQPAVEIAGQKEEKEPKKWCRYTAQPKIKIKLRSPILER
jgi:hypothetical protein